MFSQFRSGSEEQALHGGERHLEDLADLLIRHLFVTAEDDGEALFFGECGDGVVQSFFQLFLLADFIRCRRGVIFKLRRGLVVVFLFERNLAAPGAAAAFIEDEIAQNGEKPGGKLSGGLVAMRAFPDPEENLLGDVVGIIQAAEHAAGRADDHALMHFHQLLKGVHVSFTDTQHQPDVFFIVRKGVVGRALAT